MAITITEIDEKATSTGTDTIVETNSLTLTANRALVAVMAVSGSVKVDPTGSGNGLTWTLDGAGTQSTFALAAFRAYNGGGSNGVATFDYTSDVHTGYGVTTFSIDGALTTGDHIRQTMFDSSGSPGTPATTFSAPTLATSAVITFVYTGTNPASLDPPTNYTLASDTGWASPTSGFAVAFHNSPGALSTVTWGEAALTAWRCLSLEIEAAPAAATGKMLLMGVG